MTTTLSEASLEALLVGYSTAEDGYTCLICGEHYEQGEIYYLDGHYYDAQKRMLHHLREKHGSMLQYLLSLKADYLGVSEAQMGILKGLAEGKTDKEIADERSLSASTVRNHRFKLREKERQAKLFLALMTLLQDHDHDEHAFVSVHPTATMVDDRYSLTEKEQQTILASYFTPTGALKEIPSKEKRKIVVLREIAKQFKPEKQYSETEINRILKRIHEDYPYLRRLLIEYGFLERTRDGRLYWVI